MPRDLPSVKETDKNPQRLTNAANLHAPERRFSRLVNIRVFESTI